jgi:D-alanine-D-alanine ligase
MGKKFTALLIFFNNGSKDTEFNQRTIFEVSEALLSRNYKVFLCQVTEENWEYVLSIKADVVFNFAEDESYSLYVKLALALNCPQLGVNVNTINLVADKVAIKGKLCSHGIPTPKYSTDVINPEMVYPMIVKPSKCHSSNGIEQNSVVSDERQLRKRIKYIKRHYGDVLVEEFVSGREIQIMVLGNGDESFVLPYWDIVFNNKNKWNIYCYESKWDGNIEVICPAEMDKGLYQVIKETVLKAYKILNAFDIMRIDLRLKETGEFYIFDVNYSPSISRINFYAGFFGWEYEDFIEVLFWICYKRAYNKIPAKVIKLLQKVDT